MITSFSLAQYKLTLIVPWIDLKMESDWSVTLDIYRISSDVYSDTPINDFLVVLEQLVLKKINPVEVKDDIKPVVVPVRKIPYAQRGNSAHDNPCHNRAC